MRISQEAASSVTYKLSQDGTKILRPATETVRSLEDHRVQDKTEKDFLNCLDFLTRFKNTTHTFTALDNTQITGHLTESEKLQLDKRPWYSKLLSSNPPSQRGIDSNGIGYNKEGKRDFWGRDLAPEVGLVVQNSLRNGRGEVCFTPSRLELHNDESQSLPTGLETVNITLPPMNKGGFRFQNGYGVQYSTDPDSQTEYVKVSKHHIRQETNEQYLHYLTEGSIFIDRANNEVQFTPFHVTSAWHASDFPEIYDTDYRVESGKAEWTPKDELLRKLS